MSDFAIKWIRISLFNLLIVALIGVTMRYKILFSLPFVDQKHLLQGHSNFAFTAWISQCLMALMITLPSGDFLKKKYQPLFIMNTISGWGMLIFFSLQGYSLFSVFFSVLSNLNVFIFIVFFLRDMQKGLENRITHLWFKSAFIFYFFASFGSFYLTYLMLNKINHLHEYLGTVYFFLHFLYNGWLFFASMGLLTHSIGKEPSENSQKKLFLFFAVSCIPTYLLSVLWAHLPLWLYVPLVFFAFLQLAGGVYLLKLLSGLKKGFITTLSAPVRYLWGISLICLMVKLLLQMGSVHPILSDLAFGFRSIVVGYLHLVLLGIFTTFLLGYIIHKQLLEWTSSVKYGVILFTGFILVNELLLMIQGFASIKYLSLPFINHLLIIAALMMFIGLVLVQFPVRKKENR